jgi:alkylhydroperoxidase family enzyme
MAWIKVVPPAEAAGELAGEYARIRGGGANVANILAVHSLNPLALRAHYDLYRAVMFGPSDLSRGLREMLGVVVSTVNGCRY